MVIIKTEPPASADDDAEDTRPSVSVFGVVVRVQPTSMPVQLTIAAPNLRRQSSTFAFDPQANPGERPRLHGPGRSIRCGIPSEAITP